MNKLVFSLLLQFPKTYDLIYQFKNNSLINYYLKRVHEYDFNALKLFKRNCSNLLFLDIGANVGMSALSMFIINPQAHIISFEPNPINYSYLEKIQKKFDNYKYYGIGLGESEQNLDFYYPIYNQKPLTALGSFNYQVVANWLNEETVYFFDPQKLKLEKITVPVKPLDSFNLNPDFIKIDVEGFEYQVLLGARDTIERCQPIFLIEDIVTKAKNHELLAEYGYTAYQFLNNRFYPDDLKQINTFFIPKEKRELIKGLIK